MTSIDQLAAEAIGIFVCSAGVAKAGEELNKLAGQDWPAMTLLAVVVLGIGGWFVKTFEKVGDRTAAAIEGNTKAQNEVASQLALLTQRETDAQHATEQKRAEIINKIDSLTDLVRELKP